MRRIISICAAFWRWWTAGRTRTELYQLSDRALNDIGLSRSKIDSLFRE